MNPIHVDDSTRIALQNASDVLANARDTIAAVPLPEPEPEERPARPWEWLEQTD